jgi:nucleotide-binding universal stress UspA family protein
MFKRILAAYDGSPESSRALLTGIHLAKSLIAELRAIYVHERLSMDAGFIDAAVSGGTVLACQPGFSVLPIPRGQRTTNSTSRKRLPED